MYVMTVKDVAILAAVARSTKPRTRRDAWYAAKAAVTRLKQHSAGELALAPDVQLPMEAVVRLLWKVRKSAMADWYAAKAAEVAAAAAAE
jgi:hypothetical protein